MSRAVVASSILVVALIALPVATPALIPFLDPVNGLPGAALVPDRYEGSFSIVGLRGEARVYYDEWLVPHIEATSDEAGFYTVGWISASLRLFQMDLYRRVALGNLSSLIGAAGLESDRLSLTLGLPQAVEETWRMIESSPDLSGIASALEAYSRGVNDYIEYAKSNGLLPAEYRVLGLEPEPWRPIHSLSIAKLLSLMLAWDTDDLVLNELVRRHGPDIIVNLDMINRTRNVAHAPCSEAVMLGSIILGETVNATLLPPSSSLASKLSSIYSIWSDASNNWVVSPRVSGSGKPLLANDPHLALTAPPIWLILHIKTPSINVAGVTVPGVPFIVIGRNLDVAWGFTNVGSDFVDFYYYVWRDGKYLYRGEWLEPTTREYSIMVWNPASRGYTEEKIVVRSTIHGPLLEENGEAFSVKFTGAGPSLEVVFIYNLNKAKTVGEALEAQRYFISPVQNLVVADSSGNIAYSPNGGYPARTNLPVIETSKGMIVNTGFLPFNGSRGEGEWEGFIPLEDLPALYNPNLPFIATANSKPWNGSCGLGLGWNYADRFRTLRIYDLLRDASSMGPLSVDDMFRIQLDTRDYSLEALASILASLTPRDDETREYVDMLMQWLQDPSTDTDDRIAPLVLAWSYYFHGSVWEKLYGSTDNRYFFKIEHLEALVDGYLRGEEWASSYLGGSTLEELALSSLREALSTLDSFFGGGEWQYGRMHFYRITNPVLKTDIAGDPAAGGPYSVNVAPPNGVDASVGAPVSIGPSVRLVSDLSTSVLYIALPGGESGNPFSKHYSDHYEGFWLTGRYYTLDMEEGHGAASLVFHGGG